MCLSCKVFCNQYIINKQERKHIYCIKWVYLKQYLSTFVNVVYMSALKKSFHFDIFVKCSSRIGFPHSGVSRS